MENLVGSAADGAGRRPRGDLGRTRRGGLRRRSGPGDAVMVKGSLSMQMALIVKALKERYGAERQRRRR